MKKDTYSLEIDNIVATSGFHWSGSSLVNDVFKDAGYIAPKDIRADELFHNMNNFSWPRALDNEYTNAERKILSWRIIKTIFARIPINLIQKTPIYKKYLSIKGRDVALHQSTSVNRSLRSYLVSLYLVIKKHEYNKELFIKWLGIKYRSQISSSANLLIDKGIPKDKRVADWLFGINRVIGIFVYRNPRIQYQQIIQIYDSRGQKYPSYEEFLKDLESQYQSINWMLGSSYKFILISFDKLLNDMNYRLKLVGYFEKAGILDEMNYDFSASKKNNEFLTSLSEEALSSEKIIEAEAAILNYHELFEKKLYESIGE